ncbi:RNA polymerase sigma factor [Fodinicola acaciae]|uniref:RNA polymerase sigma factor n=1 Tax=Fodinicola acaciae TaxID=2681555 RepID=UPI0013D399B4|nr:sigma-70 family RNA polymerase sigma factor [Fodinicola acaciae]
MSDSDADLGLDEIFRATYRRLVVSVYALTGSMAEAQDVVSEAFVQAVSRPEKVLAAQSPEAWLRTVCRRIAVSRWRRARLHSRLLRRVAVDRDPVVEDISPDRVAVMTAIRQLPAAQAEVLALFYIADLRVGEIAATLGVSDGTVKSRLSRGRTALGPLLADEAVAATVVDTKAGA